MVSREMYAASQVKYRIIIRIIYEVSKSANTAEIEPKLISLRGNFSRREIKIKYLSVSIPSTRKF